jgi:Ni,Fe-hydrogenase III large subunit
VARASGIDADARRDAPFAAYEMLPVQVPVYDTGDVWARTIVRIDEARQSAVLIGAAAHRAPPGPLFAAPGPLCPGAQAVSLVEGWRGPIWHWAIAGDGDSLSRVKIVDPSCRNWAALEYAVINNIVPDFPLCNKSFNLSYSGNDL